MSTLSKVALLAAVIVIVVMVGLALSRANDRDRRAAESGPSAPAADMAAAPEPQKAATGTTASATDGKIEWHDTLSDALAEAKARKTLVLVDAYADWCGWCKKLDAETLSDAGVQARLREFTLLKLDTDKHPDVATRYSISGLPTTLVLDAGGKVILSQPGFMMPKEYLQLLDQAAGRR